VPGVDATPDKSTLDVPVGDGADVAVDNGVVRCRDNMDCASNELGMLTCDVASGRCVACTATARGTCRTGQYCTMAMRCEDGCATDADCAPGGAMGLRCDVARHTCVACTTDEHCPVGQVCMEAHAPPDATNAVGVHRGKPAAAVRALG
jgi:hypothetical protein